MAVLDRGDPPELVALLGPTNTGKTHQAVEAMLRHRTGVIGLPLRLLAREIYDKLRARLAEGAVALVTGEERHVPARARYFVCTTEAMPTELGVDFVAVDEIQLAADPQRGHIFTARLLEHRGRKATWFLGSSSMAPRVRSLLPEASVETARRRSTLTWTARRTLASLPPKTALIAFSWEGVYALAERVRRRRGGAAIVVGALSPRARNAQVAMFQSGEVDVIVATDAIGMGLNLDLDHVVFSSLRKFDGRRERDLDVGEIAQIAGRAGRDLRDGTFGVLDPLPEMPLSVGRAVERHEIPELAQLVWRSGVLEFGSLEALDASLQRPAPHPELRRVAPAPDHVALVRLSQRADVRALARSEPAIRLLWEVCRVPDFRKLLLEGHIDLLARIYRDLCSDAAMIDPAWMARTIMRLDDVGGGIDELIVRLAAIRTWTYVSNRSAWVDDPAHWQATTRAVEDRLSDALHERLTAQFVQERGVRQAQVRTATPEGPFAGLAALIGDEAEDEGVSMGSSDAARARLARSLLHPLPAWPTGGDRRSPDGQVGGVGDTRPPAGDDEAGAWALTPAGDITWQGGVIARIVATRDRRRPDVSLTRATDVLSTRERERVRASLRAWLAAGVAELVDPVCGAEIASLSAAARGLAYAVERGLGAVATVEVAPRLARLRPRDRRVFAERGLRIGRRNVRVAVLDQAWAKTLRASLLDDGALPRGS